MKNIFKKTGIALSVALLGSSFAVAQETSTVTGTVAPVVEIVESAVVESVNSDTVVVEEAVAVTKVQETPKAEVKEAAKPVKKVVRKTAPKEIKMVSKGNYVAPLSDVSVDENNNVVDMVVVDMVVVDGVNVTPVVSIPNLNDEYERRFPLDMTIAFPFKDAYGNELQDGALVKHNGKDLTVYHFSTDWKYFDTKKINSASEKYQGKHNIRNCEVVVYQYHIAGDTEQAVETIYINKNGRVENNKRIRGCKWDDTDRKETSQIDSNGNFLNVTWEKAAGIEGKNQNFSLLAMKDGQIAPISKATAHIFEKDFKSVNTIEGTGKTKNGSHIFFKDLDLPAGQYNIIIVYEINGKVNKMVLPKPIR